MSSRIVAIGIGLFLVPTSALAQLPSRFVSKPDKAEMVLVPAGEFKYGITKKEIKAALRRLKSPWATIYATEHSPHRISLEAFYIDRHEVTNERYGSFLKATGYKRPSRFASYPQLNGAQQPVVGVGWQDAEAYCKWSGKRLPSEEEWEKAARGTDGRIWPWGNEADDKRYNGRSAVYNAPYKVGSYPLGKSEYGAMDMAGNVWEMTTGTWANGKRVIRGGSYLNPLAYVRVTVRWAAEDPQRGANWLGFRCVKDAKLVPKTAK